MSLASYQLLHPAIKKRCFFNQRFYYNPATRLVKGKNKIFLNFLKKLVRGGKTQTLVLSTMVF